MVVIRRAEPSDSSGIAVVRVKTWREAYKGLLPDSLLDNLSVEDSAIRFLEAINSQQAITVHVAEESGKTVGFALSGPCREEGKVSTGEIYALYVLPAFQGKGIGNDLFGTSVKELSERGFKDLRVQALSGNPYSRFYEARGGRVAGELSETIEGVTVTLQVYEWNSLPCNPL